MFANIVKPGSFRGTGHVWIGLTDEASEGTFVWVTAEALHITCQFHNSSSQIWEIRRILQLKAYF